MSLAASKRTIALAGLRIIAWLAALALILLALIPWRPFLYDAALDPSWQIVLNWAFAKGAAFGREIVFTYGPLGFANWRYFHPETFSALLAIRLCLAGVLFLTLWHGPGQAAKSAWYRFLLCLSAGALFILPQAWLFLPFAVLALHFYGSGVLRGPLLFLLAATLALGGQVKFSYFMASAFLYLVLAADDLIARRAPFQALAFAFFSLLTWGLAGQSFGDFWPYLRGSLSLASGYTEAMSQPGPTSDLAWAGAASLLLVLAALPRLAEKPRIPALLYLAGLGGLLVVLTKSAFVRHDGHALVMMLTLPAIGLFTLPILANGKGLATRALCGLALIACLGAAWHGAAAYMGDLSQWEEYWKPMGPGPSAKADSEVSKSLWSFLSWRTANLTYEARAASRFLAGETDFAATYRENERRLREKTPLPPLDGPVDCYPSQAGILIAHGLDYDPRPIFQSYSVFTPYAARLNKEHLLGERAPQSILFDVAPIDDRYPSLADGQSWPVLLSRYLPALEAENGLKLIRREQPLELTEVTAGEITLPLGQWSELPMNPPGLLMATFDFSASFTASWARRLCGLLFKPPRLFLEVRTLDGTESRFRLAPRMAQAGFLLDPLTRTRQEFANLLYLEGDVPADRKVTSLRLTSDQGWLPQMVWGDGAVVRLSLVTPAENGGSAI